MIFDYIRLTKCNRININGDTLEIRPKASVQLILGTNGCGKSSLMEIGFSPLPPDHSDFEKGGSWEVSIHHNGNQYRLSAEFGNKNIYSFVKDGVELNDGHTITVQLQLVEQHFRYTRQIHDFLLGKVKFTSMTATQRRDWIARISSADFSYAFSQYNRFKKGYSAAAEVCKFIRGRINEEEARLLKPEDLSMMRENLRQLHDELSHLHKASRQADVKVSFDDLQNAYRELTRYLDGYLRLQYPSNELDGKPVVEILNELESTLASLKALSEERGNRLADLDYKLENARKLLSNSPEYLEGLITEQEALLSEIPRIVDDYSDIDFTPCPDAIQELMEAASLLPPEPQSVEEYEATVNLLRDKQVTLEKARLLLENIDQQIHMITSCERVNCPKCSHEFRPGVDDSQLETLQSRSGSGKAYLAKVSEEVDELIQKTSSVEGAIQAQRRFDIACRKYSSKYPALFSFISRNGGTEKGRGLVTVLATYERLVEYQHRKKKLLEQIEVYKQALAKVKAESEGYGQLEKDYETALSAYNEIHDRLNAANELKSKAAARKSQIDRLDGAYETIQEKYTSFKTLLGQYLNCELDEAIDEQIRKLQASIAINETAIAENELVEGIIKDLNNQLIRKKTEEEAYKILTDAMCPKSGLIAEQITQQIGAIVKGMNQMIQRVWGYPLYVNFEVPESGDLTYKFPIHSDGRERADVSEGSDSMVEIVDRAFVLTAYYSMGLDGYPLFLDEPGRTFDGVHRQNLVPLIKDLVDCGKFSQVVVISHDMDAQVAFPNSETTILDDRNINYPHPYNEHVKIS